MKKLIIIITLFTSFICISSCSDDKDLIPAVSNETSVEYIDDDPLIKNIKALNDSLIFEAQINNIESRGIFSKFKS